MYTLPKVLLHYLDHKKRHILNCSTLEELLKEAKGLFKIEENSKVFVQRFDETWNVEVDVKSLDEVKDVPSQCLPGGRDNGKLWLKIIALG